MGPVVITYRQVFTSVASSLIIVPISFLVVTLFTYADSTYRSLRDTVQVRAHTHTNTHTNTHTHVTGFYNVLVHGPTRTYAMYSLRSSVSRGFLGHVPKT